MYELTFYRDGDWSVEKYETVSVTWVTKLFRSNGWTLTRCRWV